MQTNETYKLFVGLSNNATIDTASISGLIYGLETFSQLILYNNQTEIPGWCDEVSFDGYFIPQAPWIIEDTPRFRWRGLMLDTSRHYLNIDVCKEIHSNKFLNCLLGAGTNRIGLGPHKNECTALASD